MCTHGRGVWSDKHWRFQTLDVGEEGQRVTRNYLMVKIYIIQMMDILKTKISLLHNICV